MISTVMQAYYFCTENRNLLAWIGYRWTVAVCLSCVLKTSHFSRETRKRPQYNRKYKRTTNGDQLTTKKPKLLTRARKILLTISLAAVSPQNAKQCHKYFQLPRNPRHARKNFHAALSPSLTTRPPTKSDCVAALHTHHWILRVVCQQKIQLHPLSPPVTRGLFPLHLRRQTLPGGEKGNEKWIQILFDVRSVALAVEYLHSVSKPLQLPEYLAGFGCECMNDFFPACSRTHEYLFLVVCIVLLMGVTRGDAVHGVCVFPEVYWLYWGRSYF